MTDERHPNPHRQFRPDADAGPAQTVNPFVEVTLDATGSSDPDNAATPNLRSGLSQRANGHPCNSHTAQPTFECPALQRSIRCTYVPSHGVGWRLLTDTDTVTITVRAFTVTAAAVPTIIDHNGTTALMATSFYTRQRS